MVRKVTADAHSQRSVRLVPVQFWSSHASRIVPLAFEVRWHRRVVLCIDLPRRFGKRSRMEEDPYALNNDAAEDMVWY
jgi:hypothetical protein